MICFEPLITMVEDDTKGSESSPSMTFKCTCGMIFANKNLIGEHKCNSLRYVCVICEEPFPSANSLQEHLLQGTCAQGPSDGK